MSKRSTRKPRSKKNPRVLREYQTESDKKPKLYNLNDFILEIDKNFPLVYNLDTSSLKEEDNEPNQSDDREKNAHSHLKKSPSYQTTLPKASPKQKSHLPCFMLHLYFIYLVLCIVIMCGSFGFYYTMASMQLKMDNLDKSLNNKLHKQMSMMIATDEINKADTGLEEYLDYDIDNQAKDLSLVFKPNVQSYNYYSKKSDFQLNETNLIENDLINDKNQSQIFTSTSPIILTTENLTKISNETLNVYTSSIKNNLISELNLVDLIKNRHRKRLENNSKKSLYKSKKSNYKFSLKSIYPTPTSVIFMGVFHANWMNNINSNDQNYYITKGFKGFSISICQNLEQLKSYRCYRHISLKFSYYGTGHAVYHNYIFYHHEASRYLIAQSLEGTEVLSLRAPNDALCCAQEHGIYSIKHSGFFDFEIDEHGLWLIYRNSSGYVVAKIDNKDFKKLKIVKKWHVEVEGQVANMFIQCGQLYALKECWKSPAQVVKICDFLNDSTCTNSYNEVFNISIFSRQITSLSYNPDHKQIYSVDGGSFVYYKIRL